MNKKRLFIIIFAICIFVFWTIFLKNTEAKVDKIKSVNLSTDYEVDQALNDIKALRVNTVNVPVVIEIPSLTSNDMKIDEYSKNKAIKLIKLLKKKNIKIILEAYPWINNGSDYETYYNPSNKERFFKDWKVILITLINDIANKYDVDIMNTASNLVKLEEYEENWCDIIDFVKEEFDGLVTYKTSWWYTAKWDDESIDRYNKKLNNKLFSHVDFISIAAYFELSENSENTVGELVHCLSSTTIHNRKQNIKKEIYNFYKKHEKEIFFGELGFPRRNHAATHPWDSVVSNIENDKEQARCFEAYKEAFENEDYLKGFSVFAVGQKGEDKTFYPSKQSIDIISSWYE
ncbi:glycoside hydrolase family 113 [Romboutsia sp.]|uniref:glycoside hydrolase family 113 n=1 Tax=Romboutsia sp. TaxID=1965302 RepID=UPI002BB54490|nr:hydrolase [Romboutsia sp.]HSQ89155.1 hydrolase [Romboutsia sp.]